MFQLFRLKELQVHISEDPYLYSAMAQRVFPDQTTPRRRVRKTEWWLGYPVPWLPLALHSTGPTAFRLPRSPPAASTMPPKSKGGESQSTAEVLLGHSGASPICPRRQPRQQPGRDWLGRRARSQRQALTRPSTQGGGALLKLETEATFFPLLGSSRPSSLADGQSVSSRIARMGLFSELSSDSQTKPADMQCGKNTVQGTGPAGGLFGEIHRKFRRKWPKCQGRYWGKQYRKVTIMLQK